MYKYVIMIDREWKKLIANANAESIRFINTTNKYD